MNKSKQILGKLEFLPDNQYLVSGSWSISADENE